MEIYVPDGSNITGYWIDDDTDFNNDTGSSEKKQITSITQGSDNQHVVYELSTSMFNNDGDTVALFAPDGTLIDHYVYAKDPGKDISIGRSPDGTGDFQVLASATEGIPNSSPKPTITPTPEPTDKPTKVPKPTETPKPVKNSTVVVTNSPTKNSAANQSVLADSTTDSNLNYTFSPTGKVGSDDAHLTSILGNRRNYTKKKAPTIQSKRVFVKGISVSVPQFIFVSIGGVLFLSCGILLYLNKRGIMFWKHK